MSDYIGLNLKAIRILIHASTWFAPILVPFITYLLIKDEDIQRLSLQALVFHVTMCALLFVSFLLSFILIGIPFLIIFGIVSIITPIAGIIYAIQDRYFSYPVIGRFIR